MTRDEEESAKRGDYLFALGITLPSSITKVRNYADTAKKGVYK